MKRLHIFCLFFISVAIFILYIRASPILETEYTLPAQQTLYVDDSLSDMEYLVITRAALEWQITTKGLVQYTIIRLPIAEDIKEIHPIIIVSVSAYFPEIISLDNQTGTTHLGYYYQRGYLPYIALVNKRIEPESYKTVVLHELGHALGLQHNYGDKGLGTLMYPNINLGSDTITNTDLDNFCSLYRCDATLLHHQ